MGKFLSPHHGFWQNGERENVRPAEEMTLSGLIDVVYVYYDTLNIPHIEAKNNHDLYLAQGYLTAKDRLWQMDFYSRVVFGRLSEVLGAQALNYDRLQRRTGVKAMTESMYQALNENRELKEMLVAYSDGVNQYIDQLSSADYPIEFKLLDYEPEAWTPLKSCMAYGLLSNTLSRGEADLENTNALNIFGQELFEALYPDKSDDIDPVIPKGTSWDYEPIEAVQQLQSSNWPLIQRTIEKPDPLNGSNNFAVSRDKSKSGNVLLANEPDLQLTFPSIWHASHLNSPNINVMGVTVPGTPVILIGFNDSIAWGVTNSPRDQVDWYQIEFKDHTREEYSYNKQWFKTSKVIEEIDIKDEDTYYDTIVHVHQGPLVYDRNYQPENGKFNAAMRWIAHDRSTTFATMYKINKAKNHEEFVNALKSFTGPPQNFIYGSAHGDIAMHLPGKFPVKWEGQGKFLLDGSNTQSEWKNYIPFDHHLQILNPERNFVSSANQHPVDSLYPYYVYDHHYEYYRNRRINDRLTKLNKVSPQDMMKLQNDNFNYQASEILATMLSSLDTINFRESDWEYYNKLKAWDFFNATDLLAPTIFQVWIDLMYDKIWDEYDTISVAMDKPSLHTTLNLLKNRPSFPFFDVIDTSPIEDATMLYNSTYKTTIDSINTYEDEEQLKWFAFKGTSINHLLKLSPFSRESIRIGGYKNIVNAAAGSHGPSWRMVVELTMDGPIAWGVYPGSQTGNPGHPDYGRMVDNWASGNYYQLTFGSNLSALENIIYQQKISPE